MVKVLVFLLQLEW